MRVLRRVLQNTSLIAVAAVVAAGLGATPSTAATDVPGVLDTPVLYTPNDRQLVGDPVFTWAPVSGAATYSIEVRRATDNTLVFTEGGLVVPAYTPTTTMPNTSYYWEVTATGAGGTSVSDRGEFTKAYAAQGWPYLDTVTTVQRPTGLSPSGGANVPANQVLLSWTPVRGAESYEVSVGDSAVAADCSATTIRPVLALDALTSGCVVPGATLYWLVRAVDKVGDSAVYSAWSSQKVQSDPPAAPIPGPATFDLLPAEVGDPTGLAQPAPVVSPSQGSGPHLFVDSPVLEWAPVLGATSYVVHLAIDEDFTNPVAEYSTAQTVWTDPDEILLVQDTFGDLDRAYYWFVEPCSGPLSAPICEMPIENAINGDEVGTFQLRTRPGPAAVRPVSGNVGWNDGACGTDVDPTPGSSCPVLSWQDQVVAEQPFTAPVVPEVPGRGITSYELQITDAEGVTLPVVETDATAYVPPGLLPGEYTWRVRALDTGTQTLRWGPGGSFTVETPPSAPSGLTVVDGAGQLAVSWTAPSSSGGSPITGYVLSYRDVTSGTWIPAAVVPATTLATTITGLAEATTYEVQVVARNAVGDGPGVVARGRTASAPGTPEFSATAGVRSVAVAWTAPSTGGSPITGYTVSYRKVGDVAFTDQAAAASSRSATVSGLADSTSYQVTVSATNAVGAGVPAALATVTTPGLPSAPLAVAAVGQTTVSVSWQAPASTGGSAILGYALKYRPVGTATWTSVARPAAPVSAVVSGLARATSYEFAVAALNAVGEGSLSTSAVATTADVPSAPTGLAVTGGARLAATWGAPETSGGVPVTGYQVRYRLGGTGPWTQVDTTATSFERDLAGGSYAVEVAAVNAVGVSPAATGSAVVTTFPGVPRSVKATGALREVTVTWQAPPSDGGSVLVGYDVRYRVQRDGGWGPWRTVETAAGVLTARITDLNRGDTVEATVAARNALGTGAASDPVTATAGERPARPRNLRARSSNGNVRLTWDPPTAGSGPVPTGYRIQWSRNGRSDWRNAAKNTRSTSTRFTWRGGTVGVRVSLRVRAINANGVSSPSDAVRIAVRR